MTRCVCFSLIYHPKGTPRNKLSRIVENVKTFLRLLTSAPQHLSNQYHGIFYFLEVPNALFPTGNENFLKAIFGDRLLVKLDLLNQDRGY